MKCILVSAAAFLLASAGLVPPAQAHGDLSATDPGAGTTVERVPKVVSVTFTETPSGGSVVRVKDGCKDDVTGEVTSSGKTVEISVAKARPGNWEVSYQIVSAEDGHPSRGRYRFRVAGEPRCNQGPRPRPSGGPDDAGGGGQAAPGGDGGDGDDSLPLLPIAGGTLAVIILALLIRSKAS